MYAREYEPNCLHLDCVIIVSLFMGEFLIENCYFRFVCRRLEYTREQLLEFKKRMVEKVNQGEQGGGFGGFGGFGGGGTEVSRRLFSTGNS